MYVLSFVLGMITCFLLLRVYNRRKSKSLGRMIELSTLRGKLTDLDELENSLGEILKKIKDEADVIFDQLETIADLEDDEKS